MLLPVAAGCQVSGTSSDLVVTCTSAVAPPPIQPPTPAPVPQPPPAPPPSQSCGNSSLDSGTLQNQAYQLDFMSQAGQNFRWPLNRGQSLAVQFTTGEVGRAGNFIFEADHNAGNVVDKFINVSRSPCDFSYAQANVGSFCGGSAGTGNMQYRVESAGSPPPTNYCSLLPHTTYYINLRNEQVGYRGQVRGQDTCSPGESCGLLFQFH